MPTLHAYDANISIGVVMCYMSIVWVRYLEWEQAEALKAVSTAANSAVKTELAPGESRYRRVAELYYRVLSVPVSRTLFLSFPLSSPLL
jgi:hypothetical protein